MITSRRNLNTNIIQQFITKIFDFVWKLLRRASREQIVLPIVLKFLSLKIISNIEMRDSNKYNCIYYGNNEYIKTGSSYIIGNIPFMIEDRMNQEFNLVNPWISEVHNATLVGSEAVGFDAEGNIISPSTLPPKEQLNHRFEGGLPLTSLFLNKLPKYKIPELDTACSIVNFWSKNYYHWLVDCLARLEGLEYYQQKTGFKPLLIINRKPTLWQLESLKILGYEPSSYIEWNGSRTKVNKLVVPSFRRQGEWVAPSGLYWLRERILTSLPENTNKISYSQNIYVSRAQASGRRVTNEDEVLNFLKPLGFESYSLEKMSFAEQVRLFSTAKNVVCPHGAGLTNIIFSPPGLKVVELITPWVSSGYFVPAEILGFQHACLECHQSYVQKLRRTRGDMTVDVAKLKKLIEHQGL